MPEQVIFKQKPIKISGAKGFSIFGFIWRHKYFFITIFFLLPVIIATIQMTIKDRNFLIPILVVGGSLFNSDNNLAIYTEKLIENPNSLFILTDGANFIGKISYFFNRIYLGYLIFSSFWLLFLNWKLYSWLYKISPFSDESQTFRNHAMGFFILVIVMLFTNFITLSIGLADGKIQLILGEASNFFQKALIIFLKVIPFRGVVTFFMSLPLIIDRLASVLPKSTSIF